MKIALLMTTGIDRPAGVRYFSIARELVKLGHHVTILALHPDYANCRDRCYVSDGVTVEYVGQMHARKLGNQHSRFGTLQLLSIVARSTLAMTARALRLDVDCLHLGKPQPINGLAGLIASRLRHMPLYVDCDDYEAGSNRFSSVWQQRVFAWWEDRLPRYAAGITANTTFLMNRVRQHGASRVVYVPNGVQLSRMQPLPDEKRAALRAALGLDNQFVIGYIGSLSLNNHPVDLLLRAFAQLRSAMPAKLLIVGGGEDAHVLRQLATDLGIAQHVRFTGHVPNSAVGAFTSLCDTTVDPVHDDDVAKARCPLKVIESLALGIPVITGDVGDRWRLLGEGRAGVLVEPGSAAALAQGIKTMIEQPEQRRRQQRQALRLSRSLTWGSVARSWGTIYQ